MCLIDLIKISFIGLSAGFDDSCAIQVSKCTVFRLNHDIWFVFDWSFEMIE